MRSALDCRHLCSVQSQHTIHGDSGHRQHAVLDFLLVSTDSNSFCVVLMRASVQISSHDSSSGIGDSSKSSRCSALISALDTRVLHFCAVFAPDHAGVV